jgi:hypothetical protein
VVYTHRAETEYNKSVCCNDAGLLYGRVLHEQLIRRNTDNSIM